MPTDEVLQEVVITVAQEVGRVKVSRYGDTPVIQEAFRIIGGWLDEAAKEGTNEAELQFRFGGFLFTGGMHIDR
jgi:hypothetical protein